MAQFSRNDFAIAAIAIAACFGAAHLFLGMADERLQRAQSADARARLIAQNAEANTTAHTQNLELSNWVRTVVHDINAANQHAATAAALYDDYTALATHLGLKPNRIGPTTAQPGTARRTTRTAEAQADNQPITYFAELDGTIESITAFLDAIEHDFGHTRIVAARITPVGMRTRPSTPDTANSDNQLPVRLSITTLHYRFEPPKLPPSLIAGVTTENTP